jgi:hypothetical protein
LSVNREALNAVLTALKKIESQLEKILGGEELTDEDRQNLEGIRVNLSNVEDKLFRILGTGSSSMEQTPRKIVQEYARGPPLIIRCKHWEDFKAQASGSEAISFLYKAEDKTFQVDALKNGRVYTFSGPIPSDVTLLKSWLAKALNTDESKIVEGVLAIG